MLSTTAIHLRTANLIRLSIAISASVDQATMATVSIALKSKQTAHRKTFATFTPIAFTIRRCEEAFACVMKDMKAPERLVNWLLNVNRLLIAAIIRFVIMEFAIAIKDLNATVLTCKLCNNS